jgi:integrase
MGKTKYQSLRANKEVMRWYGDLARGSKITADVYMRRLGSFCETVDRDPVQLLRLKDKTLVDLMTDYISEREKEGRAGSYVKSSLKSVKSWLAFNGIKLSRKIKIRDVEDTPSLRDEIIPTPEELKQIFLVGNSRSRAACALMAFSGLRPGVLGNYQGTDGLRISDIPELRIEREEIKFDIMPARIKVGKTLSKNSKGYLTFLGPEGCSYLGVYLKERISQGEDLKPDSPVITALRPAFRSKPFVRTLKIGNLIRETIRKAGFNLRPYVLRAYFDTRLMMAQDERLIIRDYRTFWMGHKGDIEHTYTTNKDQLGKDVVEKMREAYKRAMKLVETEKKGIPEEDLARKLREFAVMMFETQFGSKLDDNEKERLYGLSIEEFQEELRKMSSSRKAEIINNGHKQKPIPLSEVENYIEKGWEFVATLPGERAIVKLPDRL